MIDQCLVWDAHACLPLLDDTNVAALLLHQQAGVDFVSVNVGMDFNPVADILRFIAHFRHQIEQHPLLCFAETIDDIPRAAEQGKLAVAFDLEGSIMLQNRPEMVMQFQRLGVRQMHLAYNRNNSIAGGCHDSPQGLTELGCEVVLALEDAGIMLDGSHMSEPSTLDMMRIASTPVCFSHTNIKALHDHGRCVSDAQIDACAATGGVIGLSGINRFYGVPEVTAALLADQIDYLRDRVGVAHIGIGLDYMYPAERPEGPEGLDRTYWWPKTAGYFTGLGDIEACAPTLLTSLMTELKQRAYSQEDCSAILGGNFFRVAQQCWR